MPQSDEMQSQEYPHPIMDPITDAIEGLVESRRVNRVISLAGATLVAVEAVYVATTEANINDTLPTMGLVIGGFAAIGFGQMARTASRK